MKIPDQVNAGWIATLADDKLLRAETELHDEFVKLEVAEKLRRGSRYTMLRGPEALVTAWLRWLLVNNETRTRNLVIHRGKPARKPTAAISVA
jgi:hypothetical protein